MRQMRLSSIRPSVMTEVEKQVRDLCGRYAGQLPFHGWHHVSFVRAKAAEFAVDNGADVTVVQVAALVHDVNYLVRKGSDAGDGERLRGQILLDAGVAPEVVDQIEEIVLDAEMRTRHRDISPEAQALSDADTLFKALPVTPVVLAHRYLHENDVTLGELANKIVGEQVGVHDAGFYFYSEKAAAMYSRWATANLELWQCVVEALDDPMVTDLLGAIPRAS